MWRAGPAGEECQEQGAEFQRMLAELGPLAMFGELNASRYSDKQLTERGMRPEQATDCRRTFTLKPYGDQSEPDELFPVFAGMPLWTMAGMKLTVEHTWLSYPSACRLA